MTRTQLGLMSILALFAIGTYFWRYQASPQRPPPVPIISPPAVAPPRPAVPPAPAISYPVQPPPGMTELPSPERVGQLIKEELTDLLGAKNVKIYLYLEDFVHRVVATADNLGRSLAPPRMWPIRETFGRFTVDTRADGTYIAPKNDARYLPFVALVESVDAKRAVALYLRLYPLFQRAYESLGYPGKYFNDRLVAVIDMLLKTPDPSGALKVELPEIHGPLKPTHPWLLYRYSDPALEHLSSGQKILLRVGRKSEKVLKVKLAQIRDLIAGDKVNR